MSPVSIRRLAALSLGVSALALGAAAFGQTAAQSAATKDDCGPQARPCGPLVDDSTVQRRDVAPNLEQGPAGGAFRVSIDGRPGQGAADDQRAADVALAGAKIEVQITTLDGRPSLSVVSSTPTAAAGQPVAFHVFTNYAAFIARAELRIFGPDDSLSGPPRVTAPVTFGQPVLWTPEHPEDRPVRVVLRVYDADGRFDETAPQGLAVSAAPRDRHQEAREGPLFENQRTVANIPVRGAEVTVSGVVDDPATKVLTFGVLVPVDRARRFVTQQIAPPDIDAVTVRLEPANGPGRDYSRTLNTPSNDRFLVAIADITAGHRSFDAAKLSMQGEGQDEADARHDFVDGRLAFYFKGQVSQRWRLTASADTGENPLSDLFDNFLRKDSRSLLRRLDPDRHYPVYGDDSVTVEDAPTYGRFYLRAESENTQAIWGNFQTQLTGAELIRYQRGLYGAMLNWRSPEATSLGERKSELTGFAADPGTIGSREDFISTGGSVYYFRNQDIAEGSERLFVEVRDKDSGLVLDRRELIGARDYDINYIQGRVLLREPLPLTAGASTFVHGDSLTGNPVWLVSTYEYVPGLTRPDALTVGGRGQQWLGKHVRVGVTGYHQGEDQASQDLYGADLLLRYKPGTWLRTEYASSDGAGQGASYSSTGGYDFTQLATAPRQSNAYTIEGAADVAEVFGGGDGKVSGYWRQRQAGFSGPGELTYGESLDQYGGAFDIGLAPGTRLQGKADVTDGDVTERQAIEAGVRHDTVKGWFGTTGVRSDKQQGQATAYTPFPSAQELTGSRTDVAVSAGYRHTPIATPPSQATGEPEDDKPWSLSVFGQKTVDRDGGRRRNDRIGVAGEVQPTDRLTVNAEMSDGDLGLGADAKATYAMGERGSLYLGYALAAENPDGFTGGRLGRLTAGARQRYSEHVSVFGEGRYEHGSGPTGLSQAYGVDFTPIKGWTFGLRFETGSLTDALGGRIDREVEGGTIDYSDEALRWSSALEHREDESSTLGARETWATRNQVTWRASQDLRLYAKANVSVSDGGDDADLLDADYSELVVAGAFRPVANDRLNVLAKYTRLRDLPSPGQVDALGLNLDYAQRSQIVAVDGTYQLSARFALGAKVAHRIGELRASRDASAPWFDSKATFWAVRADYRVVAKWDALAEIRQLSVSQADDSRLGALVGLYRHLGNHVKIGVGYNFTNFSDDLSDLSYDERGYFVNVIGKF